MSSSLFSVWSKASCLQCDQVIESEYIQYTYPNRLTKDSKIKEYINNKRTRKEKPKDICQCISMMHHFVEPGSNGGIINIEQAYTSMQHNTQ